MVLCNVDMRQLFVLQRVSRTWRDKIRASQPLQVKLFLTDPPRKAALGSNAAIPHTNPLFSDLMNVRFQHHSSPGSQLVPATAWNNDDASWRRTFLCSPPQAQAHLQGFIPGETETLEETCVEASDRRAVVLEEVWDALGGLAHAQTEAEAKVEDVGISYDCGERVEVVPMLADLTTPNWAESNYTNYENANWEIYLWKRAGSRFVLLLDEEGNHRGDWGTRNKLMWQWYSSGNNAEFDARN